MRTLLHTAKTRRYLLLLSLVTVLSLAGLLKMISYNNENRKTGEAALSKSNQVIQNIESIRAGVGETESFMQSFLLTGDAQWKRSLSTAHERLQKLLLQTSALETDAMQQHKFQLVKQAIDQKIAFQQSVLTADSITPAITTAMGFNGLNRRLTLRVQSPLELLKERQQLLQQRRADQVESAATHAGFITIFSAVFVYALILAALWQLRNRVQPAPAAGMTSDEDDAKASLSNTNAAAHAGFRGVFPISDGQDDRIRRQEGTGLVRVLWSKAELEENFGYIAAQIDQQRAEPGLSEDHRLVELALPEWKAAGLPEEVSLHVDHDHNQFLNHAINASYFQPGPVYTRQPYSYMPGGSSGFRPIPSIPGTPAKEDFRLPTQDSPAFELADLINQVLQPFQSQADEKNIRLLHNIDVDLPGFISGDDRKLRNILHSILENAMRFTYKGYIQLTVKAITVTADQAEIAFSVADTGRGLDADQLHDLFQGCGSRLPALYHAKKLAESQQSQLMVHSTEEDGTVCCFIGSYKL